MLKMFPTKNTVLFINYWDSFGSKYTVRNSFIDYIGNARAVSSNFRSCFAKDCKFILKKVPRNTKLYYSYLSNTFSTTVK